MDSDELVEVSYYWTKDESLAVNKWINIINRPYNKKLGQGLVKWGVIIMLSGLLFSIIIVIFVSLLRSPDNTISYEFWKEFYLDIVDSKGELVDILVLIGKIIGLFVLVFGANWVIPRYVEPWLSKRRIERYFSTNPNLKIPVHVMIDSKTLNWEIGDETKITHDWKAYNRIDKSIDGFLFHWGGGHSWIPNHAFKSIQEIEMLARMAQQNVSLYEEIV